MSGPTPCMGGWCRLRDHCAHYQAEDRAEPAERLCVPGQDGSSDVVAVRLHMPQSYWARRRAIEESAT